MHQVLAHFDPRLDHITRASVLEKMTEHERDLYNLATLARAHPDQGELARWWEGAERGALNGWGHCIEMVASRRRLPGHPGSCPSAAPAPSHADQAADLRRQIVEAKAEAETPPPPPIDWAKVEREKAQAAERERKARLAAAEEKELARIDESTRKFAAGLNGRPAPAPR